MNKLIITAAITFAAVAAQAQSAGVEVRMADAGFKGIASHQKASAKAPTSLDTLQNALERQVSRCTAKKQTSTAANEKTVTSKKGNAQAKTPVSKKDITEKGNLTSVSKLLKAVFLGGPLPGESVADYHERLLAQSYPASLPYK